MWFVTGVQWHNGACIWAERMPMPAVFLVTFLVRILYSICHVRWMDPLRSGSSETSGECKASTLPLWPLKLTFQPRGHTFHSKQNLLQTEKEDSGVLRKTNDQEILSSCLTLHLVLANRLLWKQWHGRKGKDSTTKNSFSFQASLTYQQAEGRKW